VRVVTNSNVINNLFIVKTDNEFCNEFYYYNYRTFLLRLQHITLQYITLENYL